MMSLRILSAIDLDLLHFAEAGLASEVNFDLGELYDSLLRILHPNSRSVTPLPHPRAVDNYAELATASSSSIPPFDPPPLQVPLSADGIRHQIGLLQPFLQARRNTAYELWDDDAAPSGQAENEVHRMLYMRPEVSATTGRVLVGKRKREMLAAAPSLAQNGSAQLAPQSDKKATKASAQAATLPNGTQKAQPAVQ